MTTNAERVEELLAEAPPLSDVECVGLGQAMARVLASASRLEAA